MDLFHLFCSPFYCLSNASYSFCPISKSIFLKQYATKFWIRSEQQLWLILDHKVVVHQLQQSSSGEEAQMVRMFGMVRQTVTRTKTNIQSILQQAQNRCQLFRSISRRSCQFPAIESHLYKFIIIASARQMPATCAVMTTRAKMLRDSVIHLCRIDIKQKEIENFVSLKGLCRQNCKPPFPKNCITNKEDGTTSTQQDAKRKEENGCARRSSQQFRYGQYCLETSTEWDIRKSLPSLNRCSKTDNKILEYCYWMPHANVEANYKCFHEKWEQSFTQLSRG